MTDPQLQKHKKHCDMWNCETCKTPSSDEREQLREADKAAMNAISNAFSMDDALAIFDERLAAHAKATRTQTLEEVEAEGPEDKPARFERDVSYNPHAAMDLFMNAQHNTTNKEWRALLQRKKGK